MRKEIIVSIGYMDFKFDNVDSAIDFAEKAVTTIVDDKSREISIKINFVEDKEDK